MIYYTRPGYIENTKWHVWFAWYPVTVNKTPDGDHRRVWLSFVLRCISTHVSGCQQKFYIKRYKEIQTCLSR